MNLNFDLILNILEMSLLVSCVTTAVVQKTKGMFKKSKYVSVYSFFVNLIIGTLFMLCFSDASIVNALWIGFLSFIGADTIYKALEDKGIVSKYSELKENTTILVNKDNRIPRGDENE